MKPLFYKICFLLAFFIGIQNQTFAQTSEVYKGDTINRVDATGLKQGKWIVFNKNNAVADFPENAIVEELLYKDNKKEGLRKQYYSNGKVKSEVNFKNNRPTGYSKFYYPNGNIAEEGNWVYGGWDGKYKNYYEAGPLSEDFSFSYGKKEGLQKQYHPNGKMKMEGTWKNGVPDGIVKEFNEEGALVSEVKYNNGEVDEKASKQVAEEKPKTVVYEAAEQQQDSVGAFTGNGFYKFKNKQGKISREGLFSSGQLFEGKQYFYSADGNLTKTIYYKEGKVFQTINEK